MSEPLINFNAQNVSSRIEEARRSNAESLDLSGLNLARIPDSLAQLTNLQSLNLKDNQISVIPDFLVQLSNLRFVDFTKNQIAIIPDFLSQLAFLRRIDLQSNKIAVIPSALAQLTDLDSLDLSNNQIKVIPDWIGQLSNLRLLSLSANQITVVPDSFAQLLALTYLGFSRNLITTVPDAFLQLVNLKTLFLYSNQITSIPEDLGHLTRLETLSLSANRITTIPDSLGQLIKLQDLSLALNQITSIPDALARLASLQQLNLSSNMIGTVPDSFAQLISLRELDLSLNRISAIPEPLLQLGDLQKLSLSGNQITAIPASFAQLSNLQELELEANPLPSELLAAQARGVNSLFRYLRSIAKRKVRPRTLKLVLLGEPRSGKTTLLEALKGNPHPCDDSREETVGVDVVTVKKSHPTDGQALYLSVWDFAGQHIEHATHQFFLTENAIYLIVWNARQGTESGKHDLWYWLDLLKMRVRRPSFILVATHTEHTPPDLNLSEIERSYIGCKGHYSVDLKTLSGVATLETKILELAADSPSLRAEWPPEWVSVRDGIRKIRQTKPYMTPAAFRSLMRKRGVTEQEMQKDLANQLHDLGEILFFQEHDELSSLVILNPEWVTELIALVVRSREVRDHGGILLKSDLDSLWKKSKLQPKVRDHLVRLMDWFDLTFSTGDRTEPGIVVEALPFSTPETLREIDLAETGMPQMEMIFRFPSIQRRLPPGIPTWGIARAHRFSKCTPWRDAAAFEDKETKSQALILASSTAKEVRLRVAADYPPFFFGRLEAILRDTFKRYPGAEPERRLPCPCESACPTSYLYETVLKRWHDHKGYVTCDRSGEDVAIEALLSGARQPSTEEGRHALRSEMRRIATQQLRAQRERMEKTCPSVFTLVPARDFQLLDTWFESFTQGEELELVLYCEHDSGWHPTSHSLYRFRPDQAWFQMMKKRWNQIVGVTKQVGPLAKTVGKASGVRWADISISVIEKLPEASAPITETLSENLGQKAQPEFIDIETRHLLEQLIDYLDSKRLATDPRNGGLHRYIIDDGRVLWLCPDHLRLYRGRP